MRSLYTRLRLLCVTDLPQSCISTNICMRLMCTVVRTHRIVQRHLHESLKHSCLSTIIAQTGIAHIADVHVHHLISAVSHDGTCSRSSEAFHMPCKSAAVAPTFCSILCTPLSAPDGVPVCCSIGIVARRARSSTAVHV